MEIKHLYDIFLQSSGVTTDSRKIEKNQLFFALKGEHFNGNIFAEKALNDGANFAIIDESNFNTNDKCILVKDVLSTLQQLANYHLLQVKPKHILAITGSNGKTTTKELVNAVLETTYQTHYTKGNLNNHIGIPLTILEMKNNTEIAIIEMGANHQKEIASYCQYAEPTYGIITNIGKAHLEGFGGVEGIIKGKGELYDYLKQKNGLLFVNHENAILKKMLLDKKITHFISYGKSNEANYVVNAINNESTLTLKFQDTEINSNLYGDYNFDNICCAIAVGSYFKVPAISIKKAIESYVPTNKRSEVIQKNNYTIIADYYNANPTSMQHAIESLAASSANKKMVILGDMFELGEYALSEHQKIVDLCIQKKFDQIVLVGSNFNQTQIHDHADIIKFNNSAETGVWFKQQPLQHATILLKGSRGMKMESVLE